MVIAIKTNARNSTQIYLLASIIMVLLSGLVIACLSLIQSRLSIFESAIVVIPFINIFFAVLAVPRKTGYKDLIKKHES